MLGGRRRLCCVHTQPQPIECKCKVCVADGGRKHAPDLRDIVAFGSIYTIYRHPGRNLLAQRAQVGVIIGRSNETKGFRVFIQKENKVTVTQDVRNIETLSEEQNSQLQRALEFDDQATVADTLSAVATVPSAMSVTNAAARDDASAREFKLGGRNRSHGRVQHTERVMQRSARRDQEVRRSQLKKKMCNTKEC